ncbi:hypothetical protein SAMN04488029_0678 [Reichenbachiella faecimaris]|uniref:DUF4932 domain-containing protein n=1 Tax=Reichenbachiella faecimaris TaxID=692418 RepID=A0A1W2G6T3_REIFA|nr:hypothetical protein [Reichenbachiella faecimaris]SMD32333.1 hypothetical protein SAMN04488029_0678 [Reichenbachiella faecimaris]
MKKIFLLLFSVVVLSTSVSAQSKVDLIDTTNYYSFHLNYWLNMHHFLWTEAFLNVKADSSIVTVEFPSIDRSKFDSTLNYYKEVLVGKDLRYNDYMSGFKDWITDPNTSFEAIPAEFAEQMDILINFDPVYQKYFWLDHRAEVMAVFNENIDLIRKTENEFVDRITLLTRHYWQFDPPRVRVDLSYFGKSTTRTFGNNPYTTPFPTHVVMNVAGENEVPGNWLELLYHESAHGLILGNSYFVAGTIKDLGEAENLKLPRNLEHVYLFYFTGYIAKELLEKQGVKYPQMYMEREVYTQYYPLLEKYLKSYIKRKSTLSKATRNFLKELNKGQ